MAQAHLRSSVLEFDANLLRHMVDAVRDYAIYAIALDGTVLTWNPGAERHKGYSAAEIVGKNYSCFFTPEARAQHLPEKELELARTTGRFHDQDWRVKKDGSLFWAEVTLTPIHDEHGVMVGFAKVTHDLSERRRQDEALMRAKEDAEVASRAKSDFLANMSHELRTPLNAILGFSEVLQSELFGPLGAPNYKDYVGHIHTSGQHLLSLINDILDLSKLDAGKIALVLESFDLAELAAEMAHLMENQAQCAGVSLLLKTESILIRGDKRRLRQVLLNLLSNALKFTQAGGVTVAVHRKADAAVLTVSDTGIGIAPADIARAMTRFGQVESGFARKHQGTGLGLPLVKQLVELHGGILALESELGRGTTITVRLPA
jgi:PAS domain S-box-containing protein